VPLLVADDTTARWLVYGSAAGFVLAESIATYLGRSSDEGRGVRAFGESVVATVAGRSRGDTSLDHGTKRLVIWTTALGLGAALLIAIDVPALRAGANNWATLGIGLTIAWLGIFLRAWAVRSLGRFFERDVIIQADHVVWRGGPYRWLRHPAYAGSLLTYFGLGLAIGSWVGAVAVAAIMFVGYIPRIRVEERELFRALGDSYRDYAGDTARLVPGVW
jgi:protein-S-isoprenylcysteine O-methyltransferase Ste14